MPKPPARTGKAMTPPRGRLPQPPAPPPSRSSRRSGATVSTPNMLSSDAGALGQVVAEALGLVAPKRRPAVRQNAPQPTVESGESMEPTLGSVLSFTPVSPGWTAVMTDGEKSWQEPVIGWAVVVVWTAYGETNEDESTKGTKQFQTEVQPMTLTIESTSELPLFRDGIEFQNLVMPGQVVLSS